MNLGLKTVPFDRRRHRDRETRLLAIFSGIIAAAEPGLKEHDRLLPARKMMERRLVGKPTSSKLPELIELVIWRPLVSAGMIAKGTCRHAARGAAYRGGAGLTRDDGEGKVCPTTCPIQMRSRTSDQ